MSFTYLRILLVLYAVPALRLGLLFIPPVDSKLFRRLNAIIGRYEWLVRPFRDSLVLGGLLFLCGLGIYEKAVLPTVFYAVFVAVSIFAIIRARLHMRRMAEFSRGHPLVCPADFFMCYYSGFGPFPICLPRKIDCSFKQGANFGLKFWPVIVGIFNTFTLARVITCAFRWRGPSYCRDVAMGISVIWGGRIARLVNLSFETEGLEKLASLEGKCIFVFNHKSYLDFVIVPFVFSKIRPLDRDRFVFRYLAASDHFLDNIFLYRLFGRAMQLMGTIFVDRRRKRYSPQVAAAEAVEKLVNLDIDIALFPQGTRAYGNQGLSGQRMDAGYYTSGSRERLKKDGGHIKKGAAYIAVDTAIALRKLERPVVNIVPVGLLGTATVVPRGGVRVQTGTLIKIKVGNPIKLIKSDVKEMKVSDPPYRSLVEEIHAKIDNALKNVLGIHTALEQRFFTDIRKFLPPVDFENVAIAMKAWRGEDYLIYALLDCIYAVKPRYWQGLQRELCHLLMTDGPRESFVRFKGRVADYMVEGK